MNAESLTVEAKTMIAAIAITWTAGTGVTVWASGMDNELENLQADVEEMEDQNDQFAQATKELTEVVRTLNTNIMLLEQRIELERDRYEPEEEPEGG